MQSLGIFQASTYYETSKRYGSSSIRVNLIHQQGLTLAAWDGASLDGCEWLLILTFHKIFFLFVLVTVNTALNMLVVYQPLVQQFDLRTDPVLAGIISTPIQILMAWRIMVITERKSWSCDCGIGLILYVEVQDRLIVHQEFRAAPM
ncbi:hypothetical protein C8J56DRAFT_980099, partial [Mycena floridula]